MASCQNSGFDQLCQEAAIITRELELKAASAALEAATKEAEEILQTFNPPPVMMNTFHLNFLFCFHLITY